VEIYLYATTKSIISIPELSFLFALTLGLGLGLGLGLELGLQFGLRLEWSAELDVSQKALSEPDEALRMELLHPVISKLFIGDIQEPLHTTTS
jgi:hypothetical protein